MSVLRSRVFWRLTIELKTPSSQNQITGRGEMSLFGLCYACLNVQWKKWNKKVLAFPCGSTRRSGKMVRCLGLTPITTTCLYKMFIDWRHFLTQATGKSQDKKPQKAPPKTIGVWEFGVFCQGGDICVGFCSQDIKGSKNLKGEWAKTVENNNIGQ